MNLTKETAKKLYCEVPDWFKDQLIETFGAECFGVKLYERIKTFKDACKALNIHPENVFSKDESRDVIAYKKLKVIVKAINGGWEPNWDDDNQRKWWPWFRVSSSGFGFSGSDYYFTYSAASVGSRLCFETNEKSDYAATQFIELYNDFLI